MTGELVATAALTIGLVLVSVGAWMAWPPLGFVLAGALLVAVVILHERGRGE